METRIIKGDRAKDRIFAEVKTETARLQAQYNETPGIAFIAFPCTPLMKYNVPLHVHTAEAMGFRVVTEILAGESTEGEVFAAIDALNARPDLDAIVLLQPLPEHLNPVRIINRIDPDREVEGFHPQNLLKTMIPDIDADRYPMCLPEALYEMLGEEGVQITGDQEWVFLLDDGFVNNTLVRMIVRAAASRVVPAGSAVTFVNWDSGDAETHCRRADVLVVVTKNPESLCPQWVKPGCCIIDIYSNLVKEVPSKADPSKLVPVIRGGVKTGEVNGIAGSLLPIPGGLMTVVMAILFRNTVRSFTNRRISVETEKIDAS